MKVYIIGSRGNMASRYKTILNFMGHEISGHDMSSKVDGDFTPFEADRIIIATPTSTHASELLKALEFKKPILVEKPITTNFDDLNGILDAVEESKVNVEMVSQYDYMPFSKTRTGKTIYNYFKHGGDGLVYDCINIIYHSNSTPELREDSPFWQCVINGDHLRIQDVDQSYVSMISHWLHSPRNDIERMYIAHKKCRDLIWQQY